MPVVSFTAPDGRVYDGPSFRSDSGEGWVQYYIPNAMPGTWQITYDKLSNTSIDIHYSSYMDPISISEFTIGSVDSGYLPVRFLVISEGTGDYEYQIYAVILDDNGAVVGEKLLNEGSAALGETIHKDVDVSALKDHSGYKLRIDAWLQKGVETTYDSAISEDSFSVSGGSYYYEPIGDFRAEVDLTEGAITVDWQEWAAYGFDYIIAIFDEAASRTEPIFFREITGSETSASALFDPAADTLRVELTMRRGDSISETRAKTIRIDTGVSFSWTENELTNSMQEIISYQTPRNIMTEVAVNGKTAKMNLSGSGSFSVDLDEAYNEIYIRYTLDDPNTIYAVHFEKVTDIIPPILRLPENKSAIRVKADKYVLAGVTEPNAAVSVGGEMAVVNEDGTFVHTIPLKDGENVINVTSTDAAGNVAAQDIIIIKSSHEAVTDANGNGFLRMVLRFLPMIASFACSAVVIVMGFIFGKIYKKNKGISTTFAVISLLKNIFLFLSITIMLAAGFAAYKYVSLNSTINSDKLFEAAGNSITDAVDLMKDFASCRKWLIKGIIAALCAIALFSGCLIMAKRLKNRSTGQAGKGQNGNAIPDKTDESKQTRSPEDPISEVSGQNPADTPEVQEHKPASNAIICPNCGASYDKPVKFCGNCGTKLE